MQTKLVELIVSNVFICIISLGALVVNVIAFIKYKNHKTQTKN